ncbi:hypothetical protein PHLGIDRAFT_429260 [Phlebiopsis gigantea 11061_1 CR5-6]|uniref:Uncharacterized protein n=1 Tax=Phlebiopsis gigantea (strain 11061_1 CR5-6) TaxID=745531 RepID=A0A0C3PL90_PHLG1|nr:hypothetical protein PHLGIDRAFT_429260 [Phlebiopsis gigantea 11061_1 CR5-6]
MVRASSVPTICARSWGDRSDYPHAARNAERTFRPDQEPPGCSVPYLRAASTISTRMVCGREVEGWGCGDGISVRIDSFCGYLNTCSVMMRIFR